MTFKKIMSMLLALSMVLGLLGSGIFVTKTDAVESTPTYHVAGEINQAAYSDSYYLVADVMVGETKTQYAYSGGTVSHTAPGTLPTGLSSASNIIALTLVQNENGFQMTHSTSSIYCYDVNNNGEIHTGHNAAAADWKHKFTWDATNQQIHHDIDGEDYVLVCKFVVLASKKNETVYNPNNYRWRMLFVPVSELGDDGVYPVKLMTKRVCTFGSEWVTDGVNHWHECSCGAKKDETAHDIDNAQWQKGDPADTTTDQVNHWKVCNDCGAVVTATKGEHNFGDWTFEATTQSRTCADCGFVQTTALHDHTQFESTDYKSDDTHHWKYCTECGTQVGEKVGHSGSTGNTSDTQHWKVCEVCEAEYEKGDHSYTGEYQKDDTHHWKTCECGKPDFADHVWGEWVDDTATGGLKNTCTTCGQVAYADVLNEGIYYLNAKVENVEQYFIHSSSTNLNGTHSLKTTNDITVSNQITVTRKYDEEVGDFIYYLTYLEGDDETPWYLYLNAGTTGRTQNAQYAHIGFRWDAENEYLYRMDGSNKRILAFTQMPKGDETNELRIYGVLESEMTTRGDVAAGLQKTHEHAFAGQYFSDDNGHWQKCECGLESEHVKHEVTKWTVHTEATETTAGSKTGTCSVCNKALSKEIPPRVKDGIYYLTATVGGVAQYFRTTGSGEAVTQTLPYSLCATSDKTAATQVAITLNEDTNTYTISYFTNKTLYLYINDEKVGGELDNIIDTGVTGGESEARTPFIWDPENKILYQMEGDVKYVLAFKTLTNTKTNEQELRLVGVPVSELSDSVVAAKLELYHEHKYSEDWKSDAANHWHDCACGTKKDEETHTVTEWTTDKEATETEDGSKSGKCDVCGAKVTTKIPATGLVIEPPANGEVKYLSAEINGVRYFYRVTVSGESVTSTTPYSLYATTNIAEAKPVTMKVADGNYVMGYASGDKTHYIYVNASGVGITAKEDAALVNFAWDEENKVLYQMEGDVKYVLVIKAMDNAKTGAKELRITAVPLAEALADSNVHMVELYSDSSANTGDRSVTGLMAAVMVLSLCAMGAIVTTKKKWF